jgi:hypothetical protein
MIFLFKMMEKVPNNLLLIILRVVLKTLNLIVIPADAGIHLIIIQADGLIRLSPLRYGSEPSSE